MNMGMDSPMEALAINYNQALFTAANATVWAWIAFLTTAAISFSWKIKKSSINIHSSSSLPPNQDSSSSNDEPSLLQLVDDDDDDEVPSTSAASSLTSSTPFCWLENRRSGKFSLHYGQPHEEEYCLGTHQQQEEEEEEEEESRGMMRLDDDDDEEHELMKGGSSIMHKDVDGYYQLVLKMKKTSEMGWYHHQDLSMLDGNVVRFWTQ